MASISSVSFDATVRHQVFLERLKAGQAADITPYLQDIDRFIRLKLSKGELTGYARAKLVTLLDGIDKMIAGELARFQTGFIKNLNELAVSESIFEGKALNKATNDLFEPVVPSPAQVRAAVFSSPLSVRGAQGGLLMEPFIKGWSDAQKAALVGTIRQGAFEGQTNAQIVKAIRGTQAAGFANGILAMNKRQTEAMVRTAIQATSGFARQATLMENADLVKSYQWVSTLDNKTSEICQALSNRTWKVGEGPTPPAHINCRSTIVPVLNEKFNFLKDGATQSSQFGPVDANESFFSWLKKQPAPFQDATIGPVYGKLLRDGGLSAERFAKLRLSKNFKPLTLAEMQKLEPLAFKKAGIGINPATGRPISAVSGAGNAKPPVATKAAKFTTFNGPDAPVVQNAWMSNWRKKGTFNTPRLATLAEKIDDPGKLLHKNKGAYYWNKNINMYGSMSPLKAANRATMRHEWGHYLDDMLGRFAANTEHFLHNALNKFRGATNAGLYREYISSWKVAQDAMAKDWELLRKFAKSKAIKTTIKDEITGLPKEITKWQTGDYWTKRKLHWMKISHKDFDSLPLSESRKLLKKSNHIIARIWRQIKTNGGSTSVLDDVMFAEAMKADDISILFTDRGLHLKSLFGNGDFAHFSDLIGAITREEIGGWGWGAGHGTKYYATRGLSGQGTEAFANLTALEIERVSNPLIDELIRILVPNYSRWYDDLIDMLNKAMK